MAGCLLSLMIQCVVVRFSRKRIWRLAILSLIFQLSRVIKPTTSSASPCVTE